MAVKAKKSVKRSKAKVSEILKDYQLACESREVSLLGRKEVFMGKAKFGIFGDGKELPQIALAKAFQNGDFRSGYYRDQTFMFAIEQLTIQQFFAQLYAHADVEQEPASAGRSMNGHFATRMLDDKGILKDLVNHKNSTSDISPTAGQMPRLLGLAYASKLYRDNKDLHQYKGLSRNGNEISFGTIGNASTSEGMFYEAINAGGVLQVPMVVSIWDDEFGISVPKEFHTTKGSISKVLAGFQRTKKENGYEIFVVKGWDYEALVDTYQKAAKLSREKHIPTIVHVIELTQPQGHSTSGSHERYKSKDRLAWEQEYDCNVQMRKWIISEAISDEKTLKEIEAEAVITAKTAKNKAWKSFTADLKEDIDEVIDIITSIADHSQFKTELTIIKDALSSAINPVRMDAVREAKKTLRIVRGEEGNGKETLKAWLKKSKALNRDRYNSFLYDEHEKAAIKVKEIPAKFSNKSAQVDGREVLQACFDAALSRDPRVFAFGEDVGKIGDVNQGFAGLQEKHGSLKVTDTGIRESTMIGQAIGASLRGLRPIVEIQYLDYMLYALQTLSDDVACLQYRTKGGQKVPLIVRTRGHRLEGVWHSGSPIGMILHSLRGMYVLVPRNMTQAAGFYNTMLQSDDPALIIECLNGYRLKESVPENIGEFTVPLGKPDVLRSGEDVTIVTYGSMCRIVMDAADQLDQEGISCEVIDVQTLLPFDIDHTIVESLKKTNRIVFADEDVPGGATAFMMQKVLEEQNGYRYLDSKPLTISAQEHRPAYSSDGDYFSKPNVEDVFDKVYDLIAEANPDKFLDIY